MVNQKRDDAVAMLQAMRACLDGDLGPKHVDFVFEDSLWWNELRIRAAECGMPGDDARVLEALSHDPVRQERSMAAALGWQMAAEEARREGAPIDAARLVDRASDLCGRLDLPDADAVERWLAASRSTRAGLEHMLEASAVASRAAARRGDILVPALLQYLRWTGDYARLLEWSDRSRHDEGHPASTLHDVDQVREPGGDDQTMTGDRAAADQHGLEGGE
jgi:hypothetical protein